MSKDQQYTRQLELLIDKKLLPAYKELCHIKGIKDDISVPVKPLPALLDKTFGVSVATSNERKPRKN